MLLKLGSTNKRTGTEIGKEMIKDMVKAFHNNTVAKRSFKYAHYGVAEIIKLLVDNDIIYEPKYVDHKGQKFGIKIYMGNHHEEANCPENRNGTKNKSYLYYNAPILCNTKIIDDQLHKYEDMLTKGSTVSLPGGYGLDQTVLCPPDCYEAECGPDLEPTDTEYCVYDITKKPKLP